MASLQGWPWHLVSFMSRLSRQGVRRKSSFVKIVDQCVDLPACTTLEITYNKNHPDGARVWVHCDGVLVGRFYRVKDLFIQDLASYKKDVK